MKEKTIVLYQKPFSTNRGKVGIGLKNKKKFKKHIMTINKV